MRLLLHVFYRYVNKPYISTSWGNRTWMCLQPDALLRNSHLGLYNNLKAQLLFVMLIDILCHGCRHCSTVGVWEEVCDFARWWHKADDGINTFHWDFVTVQKQKYTVCHVDENHLNESVKILCIVSLSKESEIHLLSWTIKPTNVQQ